MRNRKTLAAAGSLLSAIAIAFGATWTKLGAVGEVNEIPVPFALVGLASGETLRLSAANIAPRGEPRDPCPVVIGFVDGIGQPHLVGDPQLLASGEATFIDLPFERLGSSALRVEVRPVGIVLPVRSGACQIAFTAQGFDQTTGKTLFTFDPQPDPPGKTKSTTAG
jgi:hypothetical protein